MKRGFVALLLPAVLAAGVAFAGLSGRAARRAAVLHPTLVVRSTANDESAPLRDMVGSASVEAVAERAGGDKRESREGDKEDDLHRPLPSAARRAVRQRDGALQSSGYAASATVTPAPAPLQNFNGLNNARNPNGATTITPPDTNIAVGEHYILEAVNQSIAVYSKTGALRSGFPKYVNALWSGFTGASCRDLNDGDPVVFYDQLAKRFVVSQFALKLDDSGIGVNSECIAVSATSDPSGAYHRYQFDYTIADMNDYPKFGVWPDGYYATFNNFTEPNGNYDGIGVVAYDRTKMLNGDASAASIQVNVPPNTGEFGALPATLDGTAAPAGGSPEPIIEQQDDIFGFPQDELLIRRFTVDWTTPSNSSLSAAVAVPTAAFDSDMCDFSTNCIAQPKTTEGVDAVADRLMYRASYRNLGSRDSLLINQTVDAHGNDTAGIRWTEVRGATTNAPSIRQQHTYSPSGTNRWLGSIAQDRFANVALAYNAASGSVYPSIVYTGRRSSDPLGQMTLGEQKLVAGTGSQTSAHHRWGDYSDLSVDPIDDCTFWYAGQYYAATSKAGWRTRIGSFRFGACIPKLSIADNTIAEGNSGTQTLPFTVSLTSPSSQKVTVNYTTANGSASASSDYVAASGTLTFNPGVTTQTINVTVKGDATPEGDETFAVNLSSPTGASIVDAHATGTITNDD